VLEHLQLLLLAAARAECAMKNSDEKSVVRRLRESWNGEYVPRSELIAMLEARLHQAS